MSDAIQAKLGFADLPRFLTVAEFAALSRVSPSTIYRLVAGGEIPVRRTGRRLAIPRTALAADAGRANSAERD